MMSTHSEAPRAAPMYEKSFFDRRVLIIGSLVCSLVGMPGMHLALSVGGAAIFSLYIVYDVHMIAKRLSPDEYVLGAITLYLDIINLFLHLLRILSELQRNN